MNKTYKLGLFITLMGMGGLLTNFIKSPLDVVSIIFVNIGGVILLLDTICSKEVK